MTLLRDVLVLSGAGVGGGSLVYACTHLEPEDGAFQRGTWPKGIDWKRALAPHYADREADARRQRHPPPLGGGPRPAATSRSRSAARTTFRPTEVAVLFGERAGQAVGDPFFGGEGPERTTCTYCGGCMVGCRHGAKNTLDKNYLWFAEKLGAEVRPETLVDRDRGGRPGRVARHHPQRHPQALPRRGGRSGRAAWSSPPARSAPPISSSSAATPGKLPRLSARRSAATCAPTAR